jgi:DNA helicase-2/ATP-dependent DNA helicase PcrA
MAQSLEQRFLTARKEYIIRQFSRMNPMQLEAVLTTEGPLLLLAGAGSGKTTVLINRIANLIRFGCAAGSDELARPVTEEDVCFLEGELAKPHEENRAAADELCALHPAAPWSIIAITFTNKAANELKERLTAMLGPEANDVWAMTFHSACCRILRREIERIGYDRSFTIYDTADSERVIKEILRDRNLDEKTFPPRSVLGMISKAKDQMASPEAFAKDAGDDYRLKRIAELYKEYQSRLKASNAVDFDDIILLTVQILQQFEDVRDYYQRKFRYVLIDEYQDTNHLQYLLASLLAGRYENICVVGDDDQSIYRFRGATIRNILDFEKEYKGARVIRLEQNYRSTQSILDAANAVISNNHGRKGKKLWTNNGAGDNILFYEAYNESDEANFVANNILTESHGKNFKDFAILYRTNAQSNAMEYAFKRCGIPYRIIGGTRFFDRAEVKDMLAYLWVISNRADDLRLKRIINQPPRGIGAKTVETIERLCAASGKPLYSVVSDPYSYPAMERSAQKLMNFTVLIEECAELAQTLPLPDFYEELLIRTGYVKMLEEKDELENRTRLENVRELKSSIVNYVENADTPTLSGFLEEIALYTDIEQYDQDADAVVMMTMHSAKGLEFPNVYVIGMEEGLFPGMRSIGDPEEMEEERRLCYVAITRAKKHLTLTCAKQRMLYGRTSVNRHSRFIEEIPPELITGKKAELPKTYQKPAQPQHQPRAWTDSFQTRKTQAALPDFRKGDMIVHDTFGRGMILSVLKMGNDAMLEIAFDQVGTKRLMACAAAARMHKA